MKRIGAIALIAVSACTSAPPPAALPTAGTARPLATLATLAESVASIVEQLPVPRNATLGKKDQDDSGRSGAKTLDAYYALPSGVSIAVAASWFRGRLPLGHPWMSWKWCQGVPTTGGEATPSYWSWVIGDNKGLTLVLLDDSPVQVHLRREERTDKEPVLCAQ